MPTINPAMKILSLPLLAAVMLLGCQAQPRPVASDDAREVSDRSFAWPEQGRRFSVDSEASELRIVVYPDGPLARFGHPHVIGGAVLSGEIMLADPYTDSALRLEIAVNELEVDRPQWRKEEGFDPDMSASAITGTRDNLLSEAVLNADRFPLIIIESLHISGPAWQPDMDIRIDLAGTAREMTVPVALDIQDGRLIATGRLVFRQSDFGIEPFSAAGGSLSVADQVLVRFRILATSAKSEG
ncbi:MAG: YceI family protein [Wenzhouxiangella sp.]|nr:MAG: YceI family protein [Wenzhouxiangella sp.]